MAHKVLHHKVDEAVRAHAALLEARAHVEDQLHQLDIMIMLKEVELQIQEKTKKGEPLAS